ncbi:MAG: hypothetical protein UR54_C0026G0003 [Candidatus Roizmanbacteria bacterium GW2011_GWA2_34_18]|uniref:Uncharacterized protein n=1 Tax=Candidatus Roizmanbacteria bacterium GW2011_GWA2_34_18 TaxID=1618477 RepID=A0A0G0DX06_9BACT|nr:MAG: hypothetical protein UR54_C0026G0003 [Candidatus Roizmanbacteria bacterium GW2011_GWA2_34_18]
MEDQYYLESKKTQFILNKLSILYRVSEGMTNRYIIFLCYTSIMKTKKLFISKYEKKNSKKASLISRAVKLGIKEYEETFRKLAAI